MDKKITTGLINTLYRYGIGIEAKTAPSLDNIDSFRVTLFAQDKKSVEYWNKSIEEVDLDKLHGLFRNKGMEESTAYALLSFKEVIAKRREALKEYYQILSEMENALSSHLEDRPATEAIDFGIE